MSKLFKALLVMICGLAGFVGAFMGVAGLFVVWVMPLWGIGLFVAGCALVSASNSILEGSE